MPFNGIHNIMMSEKIFIYTQEKDWKKIYKVLIVVTLGVDYG